MNAIEVNEWVKSEEGTAWLEGQKAGLLGKNKELLEALRIANGKTTEQAQRAADLEKILGEERGAVSKIVVDDGLARLLESKAVMAPAIPGIVAELKEAYGLTAKADGQTRRAIGKAKQADGSEKEIDLETIVSDWAQTGAAKTAIIETNSGGGALGSIGAAPAPVDAGVAAFRQAMGLKN
jgi:hypothetical protein